MIKLSYSEAAQRDLLEFYQGLTSKVGQMSADAGLDAMIDRCEDLAKFPHMGRRRPDLDAFGFSVHGITEGGRSILYVRRGTTLHIVRVLEELTRATDCPGQVAA